MRLAARHSGGTLGFNMTSMIDIVFLLIIFFMAVSQFNRTMDAQLQLTEVREGGEALESSFIVNIDAQQRYLVGGKWVTLDQLVQTLLDEIRRSGRPADQWIVRVRCDRQQDSARLNELVQRLARVGVTDMQLSVNRQR